MSRLRLPGFEPRWHDQGPARGHVRGAHGYGAVSGWWLTADSLEDRVKREKREAVKVIRAAGKGDG